MAKTLDEVRADAMQLSVEERGALADSLWESFLTDEERDIQAAWIEEAERRLDEIRSGRAKTVAWEEVRAELMAKYGEQARRSSR
jgi:putative addiction module component (TIGR02574 family)